MKKIVIIALFCVFIICSCKKIPEDEPIAEEQEVEVIPSEKEEEKDKQDEASDDKVYNDDVEWGPLS